LMTMSIEPLLSLKPTTIPNDRGVRGGPSHNHIRFIRFNFFPDGHFATTFGALTFGVFVKLERSS